MNASTLNYKSPIEQDTKDFFFEILVDRFKFDQSLLLTKYGEIIKYEIPSKVFIVVATNIFGMHTADPNCDEIMRYRLTQVLDYLLKKPQASIEEIRIICLKESREFLFK